jgi:acyl-[acyl-carrier-protein]-phospholipid O-acyltransferase/long-chain-fatty-acid--[acyl-carrier-protein] ligase
MGTQSAFFGPLKYSILPDHLKEEELVGGNALVGAATFLAILIGTILGGVLILAPGGVGIISMIVMTVAAAGWFCSRFVPEAPPTARHLAINWNFLSETVRVVAGARGQVRVFRCIIGISWFWLVGFTFLAQFPVYAKEILGADETVVTLFLTIFSVGIGAGALLCNRLLKGKLSSAYVPLGAFGMTLSIVLLWLISPSFMAAPDLPLIGVKAFLQSAQAWGIVACLFFTAVSGGLYIVPLYAIVQARAEVASRSRTIAANNIMNALFMVAGALLCMALLGQQVSVTWIFLLIGGLNLPVAFFVRRQVAEQAASE